jgi:hypothetical protein
MWKIKFLFVVFLFVACKNRDYNNRSNLTFRPLEYECYMYDYDINKTYSPNKTNNFIIKILVINNFKKEINLSGNNFVFYINGDKELPVKIFKINNSIIEKNYFLKMKDNDTLRMHLTFPYLNLDKFNDCNIFLKKIFSNIDSNKIEIPLKIDEKSYKKEIFITKKLPVLYYKNDTLTNVLEHIKPLVDKKK